MLSIKEAQIVRDAVNSGLFNGKTVLSIEDVANMQPIPGTRSAASYTILAAQYGDLTILVWVQYTELGMRVRMARKQAW